MKGRQIRFVIHEHQSSHHHFDLRLEMDGVFKSWAIPKGPSMNPREKRLAIAVADHPLEYGSYQGIIPESSYGTGPVVIWDQGFYKLIDTDDPLSQLGAGHLTFELHGSKLRGKFALRYFPRRENEWLLMKIKDEFADSSWVTKSELTPERVRRLRVRKPPCEAT